MAWDTNNFWWLKPQQNSDHSRAISHGFAVGAQMAQNAFENKMAVEKMAMDVEARTIQNAIYEQSAQRSRAEFLMDSASFEILSEYQNRLNLTPTDKEPPLPPATLTPRYAAQAHTALSDWKGQSNYVLRQKTALEAMETVAKYQNGLLDGATKLLQQGGRNVIQMGPKGPMVDPNELSAASEEFRVKQLSAQIPGVTGMTPDVMRVKVGNGWVTLRQTAPGMTKEEFASKNLPELMKQTQDVPSAAQALEDLWGEYQKFTGAPVSTSVDSTTNTPASFRFHNGEMIPLNVPK